MFTQLVGLVGHESAKSVFAVGGSIAINQVQDGAICDSDEALTDTDTKPNEKPDNENIESTGEAPVERQSPPEHKMRCDTVIVCWDSSPAGAGGCKVTLPCADAENQTLSNY